MIARKKIKTILSGEEGFKFKNEAEDDYINSLVGDGSNGKTFYDDSNSDNN
jgi:hypothetical protein